MTNKNTHQGIIWSTGIHHPYVNGETAKIQVHNQTIPHTFELLQEKIKEEGGLTLGIDHVPSTVLKDYPLLTRLLKEKEIDPYNVGRITEISHDNKHIYAVKTEHNDPIVADLYNQGLFPAYSVVGEFTDCPKQTETDEDVIVFKNFTNLQRVDYVNEGACNTCKTHTPSDDMVLTAKLSLKNTILEEKPMETNKIRKLNAKSTAEEEESTSNTDNEKTQLDRIEEGISSINSGIQELISLLSTEEEKEEDNAEKKDVEAKKAYSHLEAKVQELEAQHSNLLLEAKKKEIKTIVESGIQKGKLLPADKELYIEAGLQTQNMDEFKKSIEKRPEVVDLAQRSKYIEAAAAEKGGKYGITTYEEYQAVKKQLKL